MRKSAVALFIIFSLFLTDCTTVRQASKQTYLKQIEEIEEAYRKEEITKAEYLELKMQAENAYQEREAIISSGAAKD
jgi:hypothetical protein